MLYALRVHLGAGLSLSAVLYVLAQFGFNPGGGPNPFAWQLLFTIGMVLGWKQPAVLKSRLLAGLALLLTAVAAVRVWLVPRLINNSLLPVDYPLNFTVPLTNKELVRPSILVHFFLLVYLVYFFTRSGSSFWHSRLVKPIVVTGQQSLEVFCFGIVLTYVGVALAYIFDGAGIGAWPVTLTVMLLACAASVGFAYLVRWRKAAPWKKRKPQPAVPAR